MKKRILIIIVPLFVFLLNFVVVPPVSRAFVATSQFFSGKTTLNGSTSFSFSVNGVIIFQSFFKIPTSLESLPVDDRHLDQSYISGTWQGQSTSDLESSKLYDLGDSVCIFTTALVPESTDYFLYSVTTVLPYVAGDNFTIYYCASDLTVDNSNYYSNYSILHGVSSVKRVYLDKHHFSNSPGFPTFDLTSENQFIAFLSSTSVFTDKSTSITPSRSSALVSSFSNVSHLGSSNYFSAYTSNYGLSSGDKISLTLYDNISEWNFQVFELFTDGFFYPGSFDDDSYVSGSGGSSSGGTTDITPIIDRLDTIIDKLDSGSSSFSPEDYWAVYREGLIELFGLDDNQAENPEPTEPPPEETTEDSLDSALGSGIDKEQFDKAFEYVETDLGTNISGSTGAISFFWYITDKFLTSTGLYPVVGLSLIFALATWLLRS